MKIEIEVSGDPESRLRELARGSDTRPEVIAQSVLEDALGDTRCAICGDPRRSASDGVGTGFGLAHHYCYDPHLVCRRAAAAVGVVVLTGWLCASDRSPASPDAFRWLLSVAIMGLGYLIGASKADMYRSLVDLRWNDVRYEGFYELGIVALIFGTVLYLLGTVVFYLAKSWLS